MTNEPDGGSVSEQPVFPVGRVGRVFHTVRLWLGAFLSPAEDRALR